MRLEDHLVLNRYLHYLLGADSFDELKSLLKQADEGADFDGQSRFLGTFIGQRNLRVPEEDLRRYDRRVMDYEARLVKARDEFKGFRYFQYLSLLYTEVFLDRLTSDPDALRHDLNSFLQELRVRQSELRTFADFGLRYQREAIETETLDDLRRLAFFMATGSGKTLLLHVHLWQVLHYLQHGSHPEALVRREDKRRAFDNILVITPNEGLSQQHLDDLRASGITAGLFIDDPHGRGDLFGPKVKVIEIHKLADEASRDGVSVVLDELGSNNLVFVDEGHKGSGSEARVWKSRQFKLSRDGFLVEYSATFAQAIGAAAESAREGLLHEYGKCILFDYSYAHFFGDGYGKGFEVLNLSQARAEQAHELLVGGLLTYYGQFRLFGEQAEALRPYNLERPLWIMLGSSVNAMYVRDRQRRSDVAEVVAFLQRFLHERDWAVRVIGRMLKGESGFSDGETGRDLFEPHLGEDLRGLKPRDVYDGILRDVFHGGGALEVWELKNKKAEGELGLRVSAGQSTEGGYFGVINIGDVSAFKKHLAEQLHIEVQDDHFSESQFNTVNHPDSTTNVLIGAKKFIEGWSSWRVSCMGLLNVGKGEGSQVIQLFGRGVRLKGRGMSLKRSEALPRAEGHPIGIERLETLFIFGWNADYLKIFREMLEKEDVGKKFTVPVTQSDRWPKEGLPVPRKQEGYDASAETWTLEVEKGLRVDLDLTPRVTAGSLRGVAQSGGTEFTTATGVAQGRQPVVFKGTKYGSALDWNALYTEVLAYKHGRGYANVFVTPKAIREVLENRCEVTMLTGDTHDPFLLQEAAAQALRKYLDQFVRRHEREAESAHAEPGLLPIKEAMVGQYHLRVREGDFLKQIEQLLQQPLRELENQPQLPRLYVDWHLFSPLLVEGGDRWKQQVSVSPPALMEDERDLVKNLRDFWKANSNQPPYDELEVYLVRNLPKVGVGLFQRSGFYPDFILWLKHTKTGGVHVRFLDPHGLHHGGLSDTLPKFEALKALKDLSDQPDFQEKMITVDGFILARTELKQIPDRGDRDWDDLQREYPLVRQEGDYCRALLTPRPTGNRDP